MKKKKKKTMRDIKKKIFSLPITTYGARFLRKKKFFRRLEY